MNIYIAFPILVSFSILSLIFGFDFMRGNRSVLGGYFTHYDNVFTLAKHLSPSLGKFLTEDHKDNVGDRLLWAGSPMGLTTDTFIGIKFLGAILGAIISFALVMVGVTPFVFILCVPALFFFPDILLDERVKLRKWNITNDMPLMLGLVVTALRSGVEFGQAFSAVSENFPGALGEEMRITWELMATGTPRREAMRIMANRTGVLNVRRFADAVVASSERGNDQFSVQLDLLAKDAMDALYKAAQEDARKKPALILAPLFVFILTPTLIMLLTPILMQISDLM